MTHLETHEVDELISVARSTLALKYEIAEDLVKIIGDSIPLENECVGFLASIKDDPNLYEISIDPNNGNDVSIS